MRLAKRLDRVAAVCPVSSSPVDLSRFTDAEIDGLADLEERYRVSSVGWDLAAMTPDDRRLLDTLLDRVRVD